MAPLFPPQEEITRQQLVRWLNAGTTDTKALLSASAAVKENTLGNFVYLRGLIELSNLCSKNCYYCGIRAGNEASVRYTLTDDEVLQAARFALDNRMGSLAIQGGEIASKQFSRRIEGLLKKIGGLSGGRLGITLSLGEQSSDVYRRWFEAGAHRYLLRIESSSRELYYKIHPADRRHNFDRRLKALHDLKDAGYQVGTGVMIGLPYQTPENLADDLLFMKALDIDMCGMGPYIEHKNTPLYALKDSLLPLNERFDLTLKMIALLRLLMKDVNITSSTAMQAIDPEGREKAILAGANVIMPNITPGINRDNYKLYENKPTVSDDFADNISHLAESLRRIGHEIRFGEWGDAPHFAERIKTRS